jgi:hypothetical protein
MITLQRSHYYRYRYADNIKLKINPDNLCLFLTHALDDTHSYTGNNFDAAYRVRKHVSELAKNIYLRGQLNTGCKY